MGELAREGNEPGRKPGYPGLDGRRLTYTERRRARRAAGLDPLTSGIDPRTVTLEEWLRLHEGLTRTGTFTFYGVKYTDMNEIAWRQANGDFKTARPRGGT